MTTTITKDGGMWRWVIYQNGALVRDGWVAGKRRDAEIEAEAAKAALSRRAAA